MASKEMAWRTLSLVDLMASTLRKPSALRSLSGRVSECGRCIEVPNEELSKSVQVGQKKKK